MILECFHFVSLFNILNKFMHENIFLQEYNAASPISKFSAVNSGWSPITHAGKSNIGILKFENDQR